MIYEILDMEREAGDYLRDKVEARVSGTLPKSFSQPWVKVHLLDAKNVTRSRAEHLVSYLLQFDCYAGAETDYAQGEAADLARVVRLALLEMPDLGFASGTVVTGVQIISHAHLPDQAFDPWRERYVVTVEIFAHA